MTLEHLSYWQHGVAIYGRFSMPVRSSGLHVVTRIGFEEGWKAILGLKSLKMTPNVKITTILFETNRFRFQSGSRQNRPIKKERFQNQVWTFPFSLESKSDHDLTIFGQIIAVFIRKMNQFRFQLIQLNGSLPFSMWIRILTSGQLLKS